MKKNIIFMVAIDHPTSRHKHSEFSIYARFTWEYWCDKYGIEFKVITEHDDRFDRPIWNKHTIFDRFDLSSYDKIGIVDSDTMVKWNAPNIFNEYSNEFCGVPDNHNWEWLYNSVNAYQEFWPNVEIYPASYINAGVIWFTTSHKIVFDRMQEFYFQNKNKLENLTIPNIGREQTNLNFALNELNITKKLLPECWNAFNMLQQDYIGIVDQRINLASNWQMQRSEPFLVKYNYIWHFTGMPIDLRKILMQYFWENYKEKYNVSRSDS